MDQKLIEIFGKEQRELFAVKDRLTLVAEARPEVKDKTDVVIDKINDALSAILAVTVITS